MTDEMERDETRKSNPALDTNQEMIGKEKELSTQTAPFQSPTLKMLPKWNSELFAKTYQKPIAVNSHNPKVTGCCNNTE